MKPIRQDDPEVIQKLEAKLAGLQKAHEVMKKANKILKDKKSSKSEKMLELASIGIKDPIGMMIPDYAGRIGFPSYAITNSNGNMKSVKDRIEKMKKLQATEASEEDINGVDVVVNTDIMRVQLIFPDKPSYEVRSKLKHSGFRWSPSNGAWQSYMGHHQERIARQIAENYV